MTKSESRQGKIEMAVTIQGYEVMLQFAEKVNPEIAIQVKQALLGRYLMTSKSGSGS